MKIKLVNRFLCLLVAFGCLSPNQLFAELVTNRPDKGVELLSSNKVKSMASFKMPANVANETGYEYMEYSYMGSNIPYKSVNDADGNLYITGGYTEVEAPSGSMVVIKIDTDGQMVWEKRLPVDDFVVEMGMAITLDSDGNPIASGISWNGDNMDIQTMKLNKTDGEIIWRSVFDGGHEGIDSPKEIMIDNDGNIVIAGFSYGGNHIGYLTLKYDNTGQQVWYDIDQVDGITEAVLIQPNAMDIDKDGNILVAGYGTSQDFYRIYYTIKYSADGEKLWRNDYLYIDAYDWQTNSEIFDAKIDEEGSCYVTGRMGQYDGLIGTIKYNASGGVEWMDKYQLNDNRYVETVAMQITSNEIYILGGNIQGYSGGGLTLMSYNTDGELNWEKETDDKLNINNVILNVADDGSLIALIRATNPDGIDYLFDNKFWVRKYSATGDVEKEAITSRQQIPTYSLLEIAGMGMDENENVYFTSRAFYTSSGGVFEYLKMPFSSGAIEPEWIEQYASPVGGSATVMYNAVGDNNGNTYAVGTFALVEDEVFIPAYYIAKYNAEGKMEWRKEFNAIDEAFDLQGITVTLNKDGEPIVSLLPDTWGSTVRYVFYSYTSSGELKWRKQFSSARYIMTDNENNVYAATSGNITKYTDAGEEVYTKSLGVSLTIAKAALNSKGNIVWFASSSSKMTALEMTLDAELVWMGQISTAASPVDFFIDDEDNVFLTGTAGTYANQTLVVGKIDNEGEEIWNKTYTQSPRRVSPYRILPCGENGLILSAYSNSMMEGNNRIVVLKYDKDGNMEWEYNTEFDHYYYGMYVDEKENIYIQSQLGLNTYPKRMNYSINPVICAGLQKIDTDGELINDSAFVGPNLSSFSPNTLVAHAKGKLLICGTVSNELDNFSGLYFFETKYEYYPEIFTITATANPTEGGEVSGAGDFAEGEEITLTATANTGYQFINWTVEGTEVSTDAEYTFTVTEDVELIANFESLYTVTATANPTAGGTVTGAGEYLDGASATVTATANTGYQFINWTVEGTEASTNAEYTFTVTGDMELIANFEKFTYTIEASVEGQGIIDPSGTITVEYGESQTFDFTAAANWEINKVLVDGTDQGKLSTYSFSNVMANHTIKVIFIQSVSIGQVNDMALEIYPNPFTETIHIKNVSEVKAIVLTDVTGKVVLGENIEKPGGEYTIRPNIPNGIYLMTVVMNNGSRITQKLIKK